MSDEQKFSDTRRDGPIHHLCESCGTTRFRPWVGFQDEALEYEGRVCRCRRCGLGCLVPRPSVEQLDRAYASGYYAYHEPPVGGNAALLERLRRIVDAPPASPFAADLKLHFAEWATGRTIPLKYWVPLRMDPRKRILDYGCGTGYYLSLLSRIGRTDLHGYDVTPNPDARRALPDVDFRYSANLRDAEFEPGSFDLISVIQTLEHVPDPRRCLSDLARLLNDDGLLIVEVPNIGGWVSALSVERYSSLMLPFHLWHFTRASLLRIGIAAGLRPVRSKTPFGLLTAELSVPRLSQWTRHRGLREIVQRFGFLAAEIGAGTEVSVAFAAR
ncbi:MAG: class I SAM-dependent methyltransferase [Acidobacteriia bacterium]|nr:class I SAM-dependent methyltransferase [Terriglobia bacterium]